MSPALPKNKVIKTSIESLEQQLLELEIRERARSIDISLIMDRLQHFQVYMFRKLDELDKKVDETHTKMEIRCQKLEKTVNRYAN